MLYRSLVGFVLVVGLGGCATVAKLPVKRIASASLVNAQGLPVGSAQVIASGDQVTLTLAVAGLPQGAHGVHLHMVGQCQAPDFASAGGHFNPAGHQHGSANPAGSHLGDLPNLDTTLAGAGTMTARLSGTLAELTAALLDADGTALVVHADQDDYRTDPSGNSGKRIACGVLHPG